MNNKIEQLLDWRDRQLIKIAEYCETIVNLRIEDKNNKTDLGKALNGFRKFKEADIAMSSIIIEEKLMNESYINQPCDSLTKAQRDDLKMLQVKKYNN